jgi:hypothetical protein
MPKGVERLVRNSLWVGRTQPQFYDSLQWLYGWSAERCLGYGRLATKKKLEGEALDRMLGTPPPQGALSGIATLFSRLLGAALIVAVIVNVVNVVARYGFNHAITGADEFQIYLMISMAFLGGLSSPISGAATCAWTC